MNQFIIDPEFQRALPPLHPDEVPKLEESILADGVVRDPLVVWNGILIDGHHRWSIIRKHPELSYTVVEKDFPDRAAALLWVLKNQLGRRNLSDWERQYYLGKLYEAKKQTQGGNNQYIQAKSENHQNDVFQSQAGTATSIAKEYGVSKATVERAAQYAQGVDAAEEVSPGFRASVLTGEVKAPRAAIADLRKLPEPERKQAVEDIKSNVIDLKAVREEQYRMDMRQIEEDSKTVRDFGRVVSSVNRFLPEDTADAIIRNYNGMDDLIPIEIDSLSRAIGILQAIKNRLLTKGGKNCGKIKPIPER